LYYSKYRVRERIEYRFRVPSAAVFTLYSYSKALKYRFRVPTAGSLRLLFHYVGDSGDGVDGSIGNTNIKMMIWTIIKKL
jgi:hypothetical protein